LFLYVRINQEIVLDPENELRRAQVLDTILLSALVKCFPSRRANVVQLLSCTPIFDKEYGSSNNYCQIESSSVVLASQGDSYTEALLWLFRSQGQHSRVLQALSEDKCVGKGIYICIDKLINKLNQ
jgi:hypothetical protein